VAQVLLDQASTTAAAATAAGRSTATDQGEREGIRAASPRANPVSAQLRRQSVEDESRDTVGWDGSGCPAGDTTSAVTGCRLPAVGREVDE